jgi:hypothetical protein
MTRADYFTWEAEDIELEVPAKAFHQPGGHDQEDHGNWADNRPGLQEMPPIKGKIGEGKALDDAGLEETAKKWGMPVEQVKEALASTNRLVARLKGPQEVDATPEERQGVADHKFLGQCYEKAGNYFLDHAMHLSRLGPDARLVHGTVQGPLDTHELLGHSWVDLGDGRVFDGALQKFFDKASYYTALDAKDERRYSRVEFLKHIYKQKNWGPWHETKGVTNPPKRGRRKKFHLPGEHDQERHGDWADGDQPIELTPDMEINPIGYAPQPVKSIDTGWTRVLKKPKIYLAKPHEAELITKFMADYNDIELSSVKRFEVRNNDAPIFADSREKFAGKSAAGLYVSAQRVVVLNRNLFSRNEQIIKDTFNHEMGHVLHFNSTIGEQWTKRWQADKAFDRLTKYAETNDLEGFAETYEFARKINWDKPHAPGGYAKTHVSPQAAEALDLAMKVAKKARRRTTWAK